MELDDAYANAAYIPGADAFPPRWETQAAALRQSLGERAKTGISYGTHRRQKFDLFLPSDTPRGLVVFVHGGYWLKFDNSYWSHLAAGPLARGWAVAMPSYVLCPEAGMSEIVQQIAQAVEKAARRVDGPIALTGHSAGGHLVSRMLAPGMLEPDVAQRLSHVIPISPLTDLRPFLKTSMNADLGLTMETATAESPVFQPAPDTPVTIWVGADERPAFLDQASWLADAWGCDQVIVPGKHHFDVIDELTDPESKLVNTLLKAG